MKFIVDYAKLKSYLWSESLCKLKYFFDMYGESKGNSLS